MDNLPIVKTNNVVEIIKLLKIADNSSNNSSQDLFIYYQKVFIQAFLRLYHDIYDNKNNKFIQFSFRTLIEMGMEDSFILFNKRVPEKDRRNYILLTLLTDYALTSQKDSSFEQWFDSVFNTNMNMLTPVQVFQMRQYIRKLKTKKIDDNYMKMLRSVRRLIFKKKNEIIDRHKIKDHFDIDVDVILSSHSHILHGNPFLINRLLKNNHIEHEQLTLFCLTISGLTFLKNISQSVQNASFIAAVQLLNNKIEEELF